MVLNDHSSLRYATIDHVIPKSKGGTWDKGNLVLACYSCNQIKGNKVNNRKMAVDGFTSPHQNDKY